MDRPVVLISALEHYGYCRRQAALIHVDDVWVENEHTQRGRRGHRRVDEGRSRLERGVLVLRNLPLYSERYGLSGKADVVEVYAGGLVPVEYKVAFRFHGAAELQLCAQAICLEEMSGSRVGFGYVWLARQRRRKRVDFHDDLRQATFEAIEEISTGYRERCLASGGRRRSLRTVSTGALLHASCRRLAIGDQGLYE